MHINILIHVLQLFFIWGAGIIILCCAHCFINLELDFWICDYNLLFYIIKIVFHIKEASHWPPHSWIYLFEFVKFLSCILALTFPQKFKRLIHCPWQRKSLPNVIWWKKIIIMLGIGVHRGWKSNAKSHFKSLGKGTVAILFFEIVQVNNLGSEVLLYLTLWA